MKNLLTLIFFSCAFHGVTQIPPNYYDDAAFLTGNQLKVALHDIIDGHTAYNYSTLWSLFPTLDDDGSGKVWDIYSDNPSGTDPYNYNFGSDQCGTYSGEGECYNREHSVPKSWFNDQMPMYSDMFHMYPTDGYVNGLRSSNPYGEVNSPSNTTQNGGKIGTCSYPGYSGTVFEPIDAFKGDLARTYFYMMTRYKDEVPAWTSDMLTGGDLSSWAENMLLAWHLADPVSQKEIDRNNAIYGLQGNRNPFIDHPEWVEYIWGPIAGQQETQSEINMYVYNNVLTIDMETETKQITMLDAAGKLITTATIQTSQWSLPDDLAQGIYVLKVHAGDQFDVIKIKL